MRLHTSCKPLKIVCIYKYFTSEQPSRYKSYSQLMTRTIFQSFSTLRIIPLYEAALDCQSDISSFLSKPLRYLFITQLKQNLILQERNKTIQFYVTEVTPVSNAWFEFSVKQRIEISSNYEKKILWISFFPTLFEQHTGCVHAQCVIRTSFETLFFSTIFCFSNLFKYVFCMVRYLMHVVVPFTTLH